MNEHVQSRNVRATTQAAEGFPRRKWTVDEIYKAIDAGIFDPDENFELIGGEIVPMAAKGIRHENVRNELNMYWGSRRPNALKFGAESPLRLGDYDLPEPDFFLYPADAKLKLVNGAAALLVVEVAMSSRSKDLGLKAKLYAGFGVREYWVIDAETLVTIVHKQPSEAGYASVTEVLPAQTLVPDAAPDMSVRLADLPLED